MKLFGRKGDKLYIVVVIILILLISCVGFGYCLSFSYREGISYDLDKEEERLIQKEKQFDNKREIFNRMLEKGTIDKDIATKFNNLTERARKIRKSFRNYDVHILRNTLFLKYDDLKNKVENIIRKSVSNHYVGGLDEVDGLGEVGDLGEIGMIFNGNYTTNYTTYPSKNADNNLDFTQNNY